MARQAPPIEAVAEVSLPRTSLKAYAASFLVVLILVLLASSARQFTDWRIPLAWVRPHGWIVGALMLAGAGALIILVRRITATSIFPNVVQKKSRRFWTVLLYVEGLKWLDLGVRVTAYGEPGVAYGLWGLPIYRSVGSVVVAATGAYMIAQATWLRLHPRHYQPATPKRKARVVPVPAIDLDLDGAPQPNPSSLEQLAMSDDGIALLFRDPENGRLWELHVRESLPYRAISHAEASVRYGWPPYRRS